MTTESGIRFKAEGFVPYDPLDDDSVDEARALAAGAQEAVLAADPGAKFKATNASRRTPKVDDPAPA